MAKEIERKFLTTSDDWLHIADQGTHFRQGYLAGTKDGSVRVRIEGDKANLNIKSATLGISRLEYEYSIPMQDAREMLEQLCLKPQIEKTRYIVHYGKHEWEIDVFDGDNAGLVVAEVELSSEDEEYEIPPWAGEEVSGDTRYYNTCLATNPYKSWG